MLPPEVVDGSQGTVEVGRRSLKQQFKLIVRSDGAGLLTGDRRGGNAGHGLLGGGGVGDHREVGLCARSWLGIKIETVRVVPSAISVN